MTFAIKFANEKVAKEFKGAYDTAQAGSEIPLAVTTTPVKNEPKETATPAKTESTSTPASASAWGTSTTSWGSLSANKDTSTTFKFGDSSPAKPFSFGASTPAAPAATENASAASSSSASQASPAKDEENLEAECTATFTPIVQLSEVKVASGEENEDAVYTQRCILYRFDHEEKEWKARGKGNVKIMQHKETKKHRLILREEKTLKLRMNHFVTAGIDLKPNNGSDRSWTWTTEDFSEEEAASMTFAIKFANEKGTDED